VDGTPSSAIYAASQTTVWKLSPLSILSQIEQLMRDKEYEEALALSEFIPANLADRIERIRKIKLYYAHHLFAQG